MNLTHSEIATPRRLAAASAAFRSAIVNRKVRVSALRSDFGKSGRPIFFGMNLSLLAVDSESLLRIGGTEEGVGDGANRDPMPGPSSAYSLSRRFCQFLSLLKQAFGY